MAPPIVASLVQAPQAHVSIDGSADDGHIGVWHHGLGYGVSNPDAVPITVHDLTKR
ncbi:MAG: hypothetical protein KTR31_30355 [Myxococcales bacterium]|nr:hypothetical protein [Myxococcales bacterium]